MKYTTPDKVLSSLENMYHRVTVPLEIRERAAEALRRMLAVPSS